MYDLAAQLWNLEPRGAGFVEIRRRLTRLFAMDTLSAPGQALVATSSPASVWSGGTLVS